MAKRGVAPLARPNGSGKVRQSRRGAAAGSGSVKKAWLAMALLAGASSIAAGCSSDFDTTRAAPARGTLGEEIFTVVCMRIGAQGLRDDLSGASFRKVCERDGTGHHQDRVDVAELPPMDPEARGVSGVAVPLAQQAAVREAAIRRIETLAIHRDELVAALDGAFPDVVMAVKDLTNADPTRSCDPPKAGGEGRLHDELAGVLGRLTTLYGDGTLPGATRGLGRLASTFATDGETQRALTRLGARQGYRPGALALGVARPLLAYPKLRDFADVTLRAIAPAGPANGPLRHLMEVTRDNLAAARPDGLPAPLTVGRDSLGRPQLSRPRGSLELARALLFVEDDSFGKGAPRYLVRRDGRGVAVVQGALGKVPAPFLDGDGDGLPDLDEGGRFLTAGVPALSPFLTTMTPSSAAPVAGRRDAFGRPLAEGDGLVYGYVDTSRTLTAQLLRDTRALLEPNQPGGLLDVTTAVPAFLGPRGKAGGYDGDASPMLGMIYALGQILGDASADDTLVLLRRLLTEHRSEVARLTGALLAAKAASDRVPDAKLAPTSAFWDEMLDVVARIAAEPGLLEDVLRSLADPRTATMGASLGPYTAFTDRLSYDRANLNGAPANLTRGGTQEMGAPVDRSKPDAGFNRSGFQRMLQLIADTHHVTACNKDDAVLHARGIPIAGSVDLPVLGPGYKECEVFKIDNLARFYLDSVVGRANLYLRPSILRNGVLGIGAATVSTFEDSSGILGFYDAASSKTFRPKPQFLNRLVFFDQAEDPYEPTRTFLRDLQGANIGTRVCPERVIDDPVPGAPDAAADGKVRELRSCAAADWLGKRDEDTIFQWERYGFYAGFTPTIEAFAAHGQEDLLLDVLDVLNRHWPSTRADAAECREAGGRPCPHTGLVAYEPILTDIFAGDLLPALQGLMKSAIAKDPTTVDVLAATTRGLVDPIRAKTAGLSDLHGDVKGHRNDGTTNPQVTPLYLLADALAANDRATAAAPERQAAWKRARSRLVDQLFAVTGEKDKAAFANPGTPMALVAVLDILREQLLSRCPQSFAVAPGATPERCTWAKDELSQKARASLEGPLLAASFDLVDALQKEPAARDELQRLLAYLLDAASENDALPTLLAALSDLLQVGDDDRNVVPLLHAFANALETPPDGPGLVDAHLTLLARLGQRVQVNGTEICAAELDPSGVIPVVLARLVTPLKDGPGAGRTPFDVIADVVAEVNRVTPGAADAQGLAAAFAPEDYGHVAGELHAFLTDRQRGLEQFYEIVKNGTAPPGRGR